MAVIVAGYHHSVCSVTLAWGDMEPMVLCDQNWQLRVIQLVPSSITLMCGDKLIL